MINTRDFNVLLDNRSYVDFIKGFREKQPRSNAPRENLLLKSRLHYDSKEWVRVVVEENIDE